MDYNAIWNEICFFIEKDRNASERDFQKTVEFLLEKIGWSQFRGEIVSQKTIPVGAAQSLKPDIIIKNNGENIFVVELKKPNATLSERNTNQLFSYMRLLKLKFGILIGETLQVYYELPNDNKPPIEINNIEFLKDLDAGAEFITVFGKEGFSDDKMTTYCNDKLIHKETLEKSLEYINKLCSEEGTEIVVSLIKENLLNKFPDEIISFIMNKISIHVTRIENEKQPLQKSPIKLPPIDSDIKIGEIAKTLLREVLEDGDIDDNEISQLQDKQYSKKMFGINFPLLVLPSGAFDSVRYYATPLTIRGIQYRMCSQWYAQNKQSLLNWLDKHKKSSS